MFKIMVIEDNKQMRNELIYLLQNNNYKVIAPLEFDNISDYIGDKSPDLILLDINLPNTDGYQICTMIRSISTVPIIFVTSRNSDIDELMSITLGGDHYITKPYNTAILLARISSLLKRAYPKKSENKYIEHKGLKLDLLTYSVKYNAKEEELTKNEFKILYYLLINKGKIVPRIDIIEYLWDSEVFVSDNTLTVNVTRLRGKLKNIGITEYIKTKHRQGYIV
ncbi:response regulator transcription factor [Clostridiaceae bacterium M8S5]|nr:response regulator transcription factor [Clostridiaceae bacterium M8S5]